MWALSLLRALLAGGQSNPTALGHNATGASVSDADVTEIPCELTDGPPNHSPVTIAMSSDILISQTRRNLDEAIQQFLTASQGSGKLLTDWALVAETVEPNLDAEADAHMVWLGTSAGLTSWRLYGLISAMNRLAMSAASQ